jgi:hypothetical protein
MASIKCANCKATHGSVQEVKDCHMLGAPATEAQVAQAQTVQPQGATEKQVAYLTALANERPWHEALNGNVFERCFDVMTGSGKFISKAEASEVIEALKQVPKDPKPVAEEIEDGIYFRNDHLFKVVHAVHGSGRQYVKRLDLTAQPPEWVYLGAVGKVALEATDRLTAEKAKEFGLLYGMCIRCTKTLTLEESIHVGYGKTCAGHEGWWYPTKKELKDLTAAAEAAAQEEPEGYEGPTCSICDALGHGYPGGPPCPLEDSGRYEPEEQGAF